MSLDPRSGENEAAARQIYQKLSDTFSATTAVALELRTRILNLKKQLAEAEFDLQKVQEAEYRSHRDAMQAWINEQKRPRSILETGVPRQFFGPTPNLFPVQWNQSTATSLSEFLDEFLATD